MKKRLILLSFFLIFSLSVSFVKAHPITAVTNKIVYVINDPLTITGTVDTISSVSITATIYNSTDSPMNTSTVSSSGGSPNTFSLTNTINANFTPDNYIVAVTDGTDTVNMSIRVVSELITLEAHPINSGDDVINVSTTTIIQTDTALGGNFTELLGLSKSSTPTLHYGNYSIGGKLYHFVLVDQTNATVYDRLYVDDDKIFQLFNDAEDTGSTIDIEYQALKKGSVFSNGTFKYIVGFIERRTGNKIILWTKPSGKPPYSTSDTVNFVIVAKNSTYLLSQGVGVDILNSTGHKITPTITDSTNSFGWFNGSVNLSNVPAGVYVISLNNSLGIMPFPVEAFKLFVTITDLSNNPTSDFAPDSDVRISIFSKDSNGPQNLTTFTADVYYPNGSTVSKTKSDFTQVSDGVYRYDLDLTGAPNGGYAVSITGDIGANTQKASTGFEIQSINFEADAINTRYVEEAEESMVNAFAPDSNVTIMTFLLNISAGGMNVKGPEMTGLVNPGDCNSTVTLTSVKDENGDSYSVEYLSMNLSDALNYLYPSDPIEDVPQNLLDQCMIIFTTPSKNGIYKAEVKINYQGEERHAGNTFGVQRVWAEGSTVDFKGEEFGFLAPNSTVRIKLQLTDLKTDEELPATNITSAKIIEMERVFPSFIDILADPTLRNNLNESVANGTISFTSPVDEGFYIMKFRFTANVDGQTETGIGDAFFMLKKYMVWGQLYGAEEGQWFIGTNKNITLAVTVLDIDRAQTYFGGYSTQMSCTGCGGFVINVSEVRNDQQFKKVTGYTVLTGTITNSTNPISNLTIVPTTSTDMQPGWYSVDLIVTNPYTNATYFGWGWFEIRNFWVDIQAVEPYNATHYIMSVGDKGPGGPGGATYEAGDDVMFTAIAKEPFSDQFLTQTSEPSVETVQWFIGWPPLPISGYSTSVSSEKILVCFDPEECQSIPNQYVITISNLPSDKQGDFQVNVKVTTNKGSDTGSFWFDYSNYLVESEYRMKSWPPLFANTENFTINFTAFDFSENPHTITNVTIDILENMKRGRPVKMKYGQNYTTDCSINPNNNSCTVDVILTNLVSGEYFVMFEIEDDQNNEKSEEVEFKIQNEVVGIPSIEEAWVWENNQVNKKIDNDVRKGEWTWCGDERETLKLCQDYCPPDEQCQEFNLTVPNVSYEKEVFGYIPLMEEWNRERFGSVADKSRMWMYANGSHMWIDANPAMIETNWANLTDTTPIAIGDTFTDNKGGLWKFDAIGDHSITITGLNTVYKTGVLINTSYSKSGIIKIGPIREDELGAFTPEGRLGIDLDGDGFTNGTMYFAIADNASSGLYDLFFFSKDGNFTGNAAPGIPNPISVNDLNRANREFGFGSNLTLLNIGPRARMVMFYSREIGDWAHVRDVKLNSNITIPVIVTSPDGSPRSANVSVIGYKNMRDWLFTSSDILTKEITGIDELSFNSSLVGTGEYAFAIKTDETIEEWKWPMATVRGYLVDGEMGEATYVTNFKALPLREYRWDTPDIKMTWIQRDARNTTPGYIIEGVLGDVYEVDLNQQGCQVFNSTDNITDEILQQYGLDYGFMWHETDDHGYFFYNSTSGVLYRNIASCWFNVSASQTTYQEGSYISINRNGKTFNTTILTIDRDQHHTNPIVYQENANSTNYTYNGTLTSATNYFDGSWSTWAVLSGNGSVANFYSNYTVPGGKSVSATKWQIRDPQSGDMNLTLDSECVAYSEGSGILVLNFMINEEGGDYKHTWRCWNGTQYVDLRNVTFWTGRGTEEGIYWYEDPGRSWRADFGVTGVNSSVILPMVNQINNPDWGIGWAYMQNVSIFGTYYDVILANDTSNYHPRCILEPSGDGQCVNKAWLVPTSIGNFSSPQAIGVTIGENFTAELYLSAVGPNDGDGITVGNFSDLTSLGLPQLPSIGGMPLADSTTSYFTVLDESALNMDLDKNGSTDGKFYMLVFDSDYNNKQNLTSILIDDDLELLPWSTNIGGEEISYDFTVNEIYTCDNITNERWCDLPSGIWSGCAQFGEEYPEEDWENQPHWNVPFYNITHMLLRKDKWKVDSTQPVDILLNIYDFDQTPITGANITVEKMATATKFMGFQPLSSPADYNVDTTYDVTDSYGYSLLKITPNSTWPPAEYQVVVNIQASQGTETWERWFCTGDCK